MTHLSDFSYLERCTIWTYMTLYLAYSIYKCDKFRCLQLKSILSGELKSIITILLILMMLMQFMWDIVSTYVKYEEGFTVYEGQIITKPFQMWTSTHQRKMMAMDYVECVTFSLQVGVFFLMQSFWNYLSNSVARKSFMGSFEFKFYIVWGLASMAMFPVLQWVYRNDVSKREVIPQLAYSLEAFITALLGIRSHFRFKRIIALSEKNNGSSIKVIVTRLSYFRDMNVLVSIILFCYSVPFIVLCVDGLTEAQTLNHSKFATDVIIANVNICTVFLFLLLISIFHPRPQYSKDAASESTNTNNESNFRYSSNNAKAQTTERGDNYIVNDSPKRIAENVVVSDKKFTVSAIMTRNLSNNNNSSNNAEFMRTTSPVTVYYPHSSLTNDTVPLTSSAGTRRPLSPPESQMTYQQPQQQLNVAIEDPYSNQPVMFSMINIPSPKQQRYDLPSSPSSIGCHDIPMRGMNNIGGARTMSPQQHRHIDENDYLDHKQTTTVPNKIRRPSWERDELHVHQPPSSPQQHHPGQPAGDQTVRDWLWQSPDRRNT